MPLPLQGAAAGPRIEQVGLELHGDGVVVLATVTDPQGSDDLRDILQSIGVFPTPTCLGTPLVLRDDVLSGLEESFGTVAAPNSALHSALAGAQGPWPVEVDFRDLSGNRTRGRVLARIIR